MAHHRNRRPGVFCIEARRGIRFQRMSCSGFQPLMHAPSCGRMRPQVHSLARITWYSLAGSECHFFHPGFEGRVFGRENLLILRAFANAAFAGGLAFQNSRLSLRRLM
jgi:hypothetical protein